MSTRSLSLIVVGVLCAVSILTADAEESTDLTAESCVSDCSACCEPCSCVVSPWEVRAGAMVLRRSRLPQRVLAWNIEGVQEETRTPLATTRNFNFDAQGDAEISLLRHGDRADLEFRWFQTQDFVGRAPQVVGGQDGALLTDIGPDTIETFGVTEFSADYRTRMSSFELNVRAPDQDRLFIPFCGFRYLELNEWFSEILYMPVELLDIRPTVKSFNNLYGFQIGSDMNLWNQGGPFRLTAVGKAGIYGNHATDRYRVLIGGEEVSIANGSTNATAFVGELGLVGTWQLSRRLRARVGYEILWLDGVAQAALQTTRGTQTVPFPVNPHGTAYFYGAQFGFDYCW